MILEMILREEDGDFSLNDKQQALYDRYKTSKFKRGVTGAAIGGAIGGLATGGTVGGFGIGAAAGAIHQRNRATLHNRALKAGIQGKEYKPKEHLRRAVTHGAIGAMVGSTVGSRKTGKLNGKNALIGAGIGAAQGLISGWRANKKLKKVNQQAQQKAREVGAI